MIIVAVSGGIDSMVLLDKLYKQGQKIIIAHVNYKKRNDSYKDEIVIRNYIKDKDIILETLVVSEDYSTENFQAQARSIRYNFFCDLAKKYDVYDIYLAHHYNDYLETYFFQKIRQGLYNHWALANTSTFRNCTLHRPLLNLTKNEIKDYAQKHDIKYHEDSSNQSMVYTRNRLRKVIEKTSKEDLDMIYQQSVLDNKLIEIENIIIEKYFSKNIFNVQELNSLSDNLLKRILFSKIKDYQLSGKYLEEIIRLIKEVDKFENKRLDTTIIKNYGKILFIDCSSLEYNFLIKDDEDFHNIENYFKDNFAYEIRKPKVDFPYIVRNYLENDLDFLELDKKKFKRKLMKRKVPLFLRNNLPIVEKNGEVKELI